MMQIGATAKMVKELKQDIQPLDSTDVPEIYQWHMNLFTFQRRKCIILMNNATGLNMTLFGLKQAQFENMDQVIGGSLRELLRLLEVDQNIMADLLAAGQEIIYTKTHNRSVIGMMTELKHHMEARLEGQSYEEIDAVTVNEKNNQMLFSPLKNNTPIETLRAYYQDDL